MSVISAAACHANPDIDGKTVAGVGSESAPPDCPAVCTRLEALCGYAPVDCTNADKTGYCDTQLGDDAERVCIGAAETSSCQAAWDCVANATPADDEDAGDDDASTDEDAALEPVDVDAGDGG